MSAIHLWRGYHGAEFQTLFTACWAKGELLIACPPGDIDLDFTGLLPQGELHLAGDWPDAARRRFAKARGADRRRHAPDYPAPAVLGVFTTGTTGGGQRLVVFSRANIIASQTSIFDLYDPARVRALFCYPQPYHVFGLLLGYALAELRGIPLIATAGPYGRASHERWLASPEENLLTLATPSHLVDLCGYLATTKSRPRPSYSCILGGARVEQSVWHAARTECAIAEPSIGYGCTEASPGVAHLPPGVAPLADGDIGWPLPHATLSDLDESGYTLRGPSICLAIIEGGSLTFPTSHRVHDELAPLPDGRLVCRGRTDLVLNRGGEKFPLERIEALLKERHQLDAICVAVPDARLGSELGIVACARAAAGEGSLSGAIYETLAEVFLRRFNPAHLRLVETLPLNRNAKPDRQAAVRLLERQ